MALPRQVLSDGIFVPKTWSRGHHWQPCKADLHLHTHVRPRLHATALHAGHKCRILLRRIIAGMGPASAVVSSCRAACKAAEGEGRCQWCPSHGLLLPSSTGILGNPTVLQLHTARRTWAHLPHLLLPHPVVQQGHVDDNAKEEGGEEGAATGARHPDGPDRPKPRAGHVKTWSGSQKTTTEATRQVKGMAGGAKDYS